MGIQDVDYFVGNGMVKQVAQQLWLLFVWERGSLYLVSEYKYNIVTSFLMVSKSLK